MRLSIITAGFGILAGVLAIPTLNSKRHVVHERRDQPPRNWARGHQLRGDTFLPVRIALAQNNLDKANEYLMDVSHPDSPNYGKHWTAQEVADVFAPSDITIRSVLRWLEEAGITSDRVTESRGRNWLQAQLTVHEAERLLKTKYYEYTHAETGQVHVACEDYSIPEEVKTYVDFITPTVHFDTRIVAPIKRRELGADVRESGEDFTSSVGKKVEPGIAHSIGSLAGTLPKQHDIALPLGIIDDMMDELDNCSVSINPACLRALYMLPDMDFFDLNPANSFGIVEYTPQAYLATDLDIFFGNYSPALVGARPELVSIAGGYLQPDIQHMGVNSESNLDLGYAMALSYPQTVTLYQTGDSLQGASFNNFLDALDGTYCTFDGGDDPIQDGIYSTGEYNDTAICGGVDAAHVISSSYGYNEADLTPFYEMRQCNEYLKLGLQGTTFLYSSGDSGVAGNGGQCIDMTSNSYNSGASGMFNPGFPSSCPYITSVGATQIKANASVTQPEVAAESIIYSGGGFSNVFDAPPYQEAALATYFAEHMPSYGSDRYNTSQKSRGFPDVSANGVNYAMAVNGKITHLYGTSAAAPTFGSVMTLINSARLDVGKRPVGFLNPALYANPSMLNDITSGHNQGCGTPGFEAVRGWDPVTGLGTPNFPRMLAYFMALP